MLIEDNPNLEDFGVWPKKLKKINGGVRIIRNSVDIDGADIKKIESKAAEA